MNFILETIAFNIESCVKAQDAGAHRIELCANPHEGGTTPSYGFIKAARGKLNIPLYPMIRPRGGDFLYTDEEFEVMKIDVRICKELQCDGIVIGMLNEDATIDKTRCSILVNMAYPMGVTFHRAFDRVADPVSALQDIIEIGCERILTSGLQKTAQEGAENIKMLIDHAGERIIIMPGSGIRADNVISLVERTGAAEFHTSARMASSTKMKTFNQNMDELLHSVDIDTEELKSIIISLNKL